jgi:hypothetical protein
MALGLGGIVHLKDRPNTSTQRQQVGLCFAALYVGHKQRSQHRSGTSAGTMPTMPKKCMIPGLWVAHPADPKTPFDGVGHRHITLPAQPEVSHRFKRRDGILRFAAEQRQQLAAGVGPQSNKI